MSLPWLGPDWHLAGNLDDVTRCLRADSRFGLAPAGGATRQKQEQTKESISWNTGCFLGKCVNKNMILLIFFQLQKSSSLYPTVVLVNLLKILIYDLIVKFFFAKIFEWHEKNRCCSFCELWHQTQATAANLICMNWFFKIYIKQILPPHTQINACLHLNMYCISRVHVLLCSLYVIWLHIEALNKLGKCRCKAELSWTKCTFRLHLYIGEAFIKYFTCKAQSMHCKVNAAFSMLQNKIN